MQRRDVVVIGGGPAGSAAALRLASAGASVLMIERGELGRDKVCGDGLTPRAIRALEALNVPIDAAHRTDGLRMIANRTVRELRWPGVAPFPAHGAAWQRRFLDAPRVEAAAAAGAEIRHGSDALPALEGDAVVGVDVDGERIHADLVVLATGATGTAARMVGAVRDPDEPFGLAIRTYAASPRHAERHLEACLTLRDGAGTPVPGYGWIFPLGDGTVNIGVGALSTMKGFRTLNLNHLQESYRALVRSSWELGPDLERPRAWRLPMSAQRRHGPGWVAVGDAAGLVNPMNGEGIDYALESGMLAADLFVANPATTPERYDREIGERFDAFLRTGRRFSFLVGHPLVLRGGLRLAVGTDAIASITLQVMGNLVDSATPGLGGRTMRAADRVLGALDPALRRFRAPA